MKHLSIKSLNTHTVLSQAWRLARIVVWAFLASDLAPALASGHLSRQALVAGLTGVAEVAYRAAFPTSKKDPSREALLRILVAHLIEHHANTEQVVQDVQQTVAEVVETPPAAPVEAVVPVPVAAPVEAAPVVPVSSPVAPPAAPAAPDAPPQVQA